MEKGYVSLIPLFLRGRIQQPEALLPSGTIAHGHGRSKYHYTAPPMYEEIKNKHGFLGGFVLFIVSLTLQWLSNGICHLFIIVSKVLAMENVLSGPKV